MMINLAANKIISVVGLILFISCAIILKYRTYSINQISKNIALTIDGPARKMWDERAYNYELYAYVFSAENPDGIQQGEKPIIKEIGPFVFDMHMRRVDIVDHKEDDTVSYLMKRNYVFNAEKSKSLKNDTVYSFANFLILSVVNFILKSRPTIVPLASRSIDALFDKPPNLYFNTTIQQFLFDGIEVNCTGAEEFFKKVICNDFKEFWYNYRLVKTPGQEFYRSSTWGWLNDTLDWVGPTRIKRGIKNLADVAKVVQYNNATNLSTWDDEKCDAFKGTDGSAFSPYLTRKDTLHVVNTILSRTFTYQYDSDVQHLDLLKTYRFTATVGTDLETNPDHKCYCAGACIKNGVFETLKDMNWALVISNPHFYAADPYYISRLIGMQPNKGKHLSYIDVDPLTGIVVEAAFRIQYNGQLVKQPKVRLMKTISEGFIPIGWYEERFTLTRSQIEDINEIHTTIFQEKIVLCILVIVGLFLYGYGVGSSISDLNKGLKMRRVVH